MHVLHCSDHSPQHLNPHVLPLTLLHCLRCRGAQPPAHDVVPAGHAVPAGVAAGLDQTVRAVQLLEHEENVSCLQAAAAAAGLQVLGYIAIQTSVLQGNHGHIRILC